MREKSQKHLEYSNFINGRDAIYTIIDIISFGIRCVINFSGFCKIVSPYFLYFIH